jgi:hypothetical protein
MSYLTKLPGVLDADDVKPGMAYFANTGPFGKTCATCAHRGYWRNGRAKFNPRTNLIEEKRVRSSGCAMFLKLSGRHGPRVDTKWNACKFYEHKQS